ncbi:hypothetical protein PI125_g11951 [Phytophthora idaei]|nr:hypothetical protein PI125_g11951 [Phytophthora idaei]KAG3150765.1 hypothetical protein PI126_g11328 [Phytophthora idaei]
MAPYPMALASTIPCTGGAVAFEGADDRLEDGAGSVLFDQTE